MVVEASARERKGALNVAWMCWLVWSLALILGFNTLFPLEWTHPYCNNPTDGPAWAAYGLPLPYRRYSGVSSLAFDIMPHVLLLNVLVLAALAYPLMRWSVRRLSRCGKLTSVIAAVPGLLLLLLCLAFLWFEFGTGFLVSSISAGGDSYWAYRPVGISLMGSQKACTPSEFWFSP